MAVTLPRFYRHLQKVADMQKVARIVLEAEGETEVPKSAAGATAGGDQERMRGVPVIGRGTAGAIKGTSPLGALVHKEQRQRRNGH